MTSIAQALMSVAYDILFRDLDLAEGVAVRALTLITTFHCRYPEYPVGPVLH